MAEVHALRSRSQVAVALAVVTAAAFLLRCLGLEQVFPGDGVVVLAIGDGAYHARLAAWAFANFPGWLSFDPYLAGPLGGPVPWPPLFDLLVAAVAKVSGGGVETVEAVLAWSNPVLGALTGLAVYAAARALAGRGVAVGAAAVHAVLGVGLQYGAVGYGDHHAFVALVGAAWLALALGLLRGDGSPRPLWGLGLGLAVARSAMLLGWAGSLLYVVVADGGLLLALTLLGDRRRLRVVGWGALATAAVAAPVVWVGGRPAGGPWSAITLSNLHLLVCVGLAAASLVGDRLEGLRPAGSPGRRLARMTAIVALLLLAAVALPVAEGVSGGLRFLTMRDAVGSVTFEQQPLLTLMGRQPVEAPRRMFGYLSYVLLLLPLAPLAAARDRSRRPVALLLAGWAGAFALLTMTQMRYGCDLAPSASICIALLLGGLAAGLHERLRLRRGVAVGAGVAVGVALLVAPNADVLWVEGVASGRWLRGDRGPGRDPLVATPMGTLVRFALQVRAATPPTPGYLAAGAAPSYGLLCEPDLGHALRHYARRPVAADNFWDKFPTFERAAGLLRLDDEARAVATARELEVRYLVTAAGRGRPGSIGDRLQRFDGAGPAGEQPLERFRLVTEGPAGGRPIGDLLGTPARRERACYKLFEVVAGATAEVPCADGDRVEGLLQVQTPLGRRFLVRVEAEAGEDGFARMRLSYATRTVLPVRPLGPWRLRSGGREWRLDLTDAEVEGGAVVRLDGAGS